MKSARWLADKLYKIIRLNGTKTLL